MFFSEQKQEKRKRYQELLAVVGSLSNLFSDSESPYINYRVAEKIFCNAFDAEDLSRSDVAIDAKKGDLGIGLKTFLAGNDNTFQKIAEFNKQQDQYSGLSPRQMAEKVSELRNARLDVVASIYGISNFIYHCVLRGKGHMKIYEEKMSRVDVLNIYNVKSSGKVITFNDGTSDYKFSISKSTLYKRFSTNDVEHRFSVEIIPDPLFALSKLHPVKSLDMETKNKTKETIYLPLYGRNRTVFKKSGLNQWNAGGRARDPDEVYIPIPRVIHRTFPDFFPDRDTYFRLRFPDGEVVEAKVCQDNGKALMTKSNKKLGKLVLRDILKLKEWDLVTYEKLEFLGIDSVRIDKLDGLLYEINFSGVNSYENFIEEHAL